MLGQRRAVQCMLCKTAVGAQDRVLTAGKFPKIFLAGGRMAVLGRLAARYPSLKQNQALACPAELCLVPVRGSD